MARTSQVAPKTTTTSGAPRKRVLEACTFCRGRKIKCNNERPVCSNCQTYGRTCVFEAIDDAERRASKPRAARRAKSRTEVTPTSGRTSTHDPGNDNDEPDDNNRNGNSNDHNNAPTDNSQRSVSRLIHSAEGISSYHGRTSALFEDTNAPEQRAAPPRASMPVDWVQKGLIAEAAQQKQMERLNYHRGKLDFDGIEPELGMHLLDLHWNRQHHSYLITYRPAFMRDMACSGPYFSKLLLNAIYFSASKFSPRPEVRRDPDDVRTAGYQYRMRVKELLGNALDSSNITTIQALLMMAQSLFALGDERSAAWLYAGIAFRMLIDLGMHADTLALQNTRRSSDEDIEIRRRVFWGAFVVDKMQSLYQGRPVSLQDSDARVPITFLDTYEEYEDWKPFAYDPHAREGTYSGSPAYSVSTFSALCRLSVIMNSVLNNIYAEAAFDKSADELSDLQRSFDARLEKWYEELPQHLKIGPSEIPAVIPPPHVLSLMAIYNVLLILLHRPFVSDGHLHSNARSITVNSLLVCAKAATAIVHILRLYHEAFSVRRAPYLISYATYVSATIHIRIAAKRQYGSDAHKSLATCLEVFRVNQESNWAARRAHNIVEGLARKLGIELPDTTSGALAPNNARPPPPYQQQQSSSSSLNQQPQEQNNAYTSSDSNWQQGFSPTMDIDAIIQSFAREQDNPHLANGVLQQSSNPNGPPNNMPTSIAYDTGSAYPPGGQEFTQQAAGYSTGGAWAMPPGDVALDDLLFGFNSTTMDNFSMPYGYG